MVLLRPTDAATVQPGGVSPHSPCLSFPMPVLTPLSLQCYMGPSSDKALTFMKDHFLMDGKVSPIQGRPLLVKTDVTYTRIVVDETRGVSGATYRVMFLATGGFPWGYAQGAWLPFLPFPWCPKTPVMSPVPLQRRVSCTKRWSCLRVPILWKASSSSGRRSR